MSTTEPRPARPSAARRRLPAAVGVVGAAFGLVLAARVLLAAPDPPETQVLRFAEARSGNQEVLPLEVPASDWTEQQREYGEVMGELNRACGQVLGSACDGQLCATLEVRSQLPLAPLWERPREVATWLGAVLGVPPEGHRCGSALMAHQELALDRPRGAKLEVVAGGRLVECVVLSAESVELQPARRLCDALLQGRADVPDDFGDARVTVSSRSYRLE